MPLINAADNPVPIKTTKSVRKYHKTVKGWKIGAELNIQGGKKDAAGAALKISGEKTFEEEFGDEESKQEERTFLCPAWSQCVVETWTWHLTIEGRCRRDHDPTITCESTKSLCDGDMTLLQYEPGFDWKKLFGAPSPNFDCQELALKNRHCKRRDELVPCQVSVPITNNKAVHAMEVALFVHLDKLQWSSPSGNESVPQLTGPLQQMGIILPEQDKVLSSVNSTATCK